jgi:hypothetical protein
VSRSRPLIAASIAIVLLGAAQAAQGTTASSGSKALTARPADGYHSIPNAFAGFNAPFRKNSWLALTPELRQAAAGLSPGALRVFGGTTANYWNWRTGKFYDRHGVPRQYRRAYRRMSPIYMADWAQLVQGANAIPVFDLNLVTSHLSHQLDMLRRARELGMPVRWVELGNELYFHAPLIDEAIPSARAYGRKATRWIDAIKKEFPHARVAAVGFGGPRSWSGDARRRHWDWRMLSTLRGEDALTFHTYWRTPRGRLSPPRLAKVLAAPLRRLAVLRSAGLGKLPGGVQAWVTEWNVWHGSSLRGTWVNGLMNAEYLLGLLGETRVRQEDLHALIFRNPFAALFPNQDAFGDQTSTVPFAPTATGRALGELHPLLYDGPGVRRLKIRHAPRIDGTRFPAVRAVEVEGRGALLLNLTDRQRRVRPAGASACEGTLDSIWARPGVRITGHAGEVSHRTVQTEGSMRLPRYSVNRLSC